MLFCSKEVSKKRKYSLRMIADPCYETIART